MSKSQGHQSAPPVSASLSLEAAKNASAGTSSAGIRLSAMDLKAVSSSASALALRNCTLSPIVRAASSTSFCWLGAVALLGLSKTPTVSIPGFTSRKRPRRLASITAFKLLTPVIFPPGRLRLVTNPPATGSPMNTATIGVVRVAAAATLAVMSPPTDTSTVGCRLRRSVACPASRS